MIHALHLSNRTAKGAQACFGVCCPMHHQCERYAAVSQTEASPDTRATCMEFKTYPLFLTVVVASAVAA